MSVLSGILTGLNVAGNVENTVGTMAGAAKELAKKLDEIVPNGCGIIVYNSWVHFDVRDGKKYRKGV